MMKISSQQPWHYRNVMTAHAILYRTFKHICWPLSRAYAKHVAKDEPADAWLRFLSSIQFSFVYRFWPDLSAPAHLSEKIWNRMLHARDPILTTICDKLQVRSYAAQKVGHEYLIPLIWTGENAHDIPFDDLPSTFVIKTNHGAGYYLIVDDKSRLRKNVVAEKVNSWLLENYCTDRYLGIEWAYKHIQPRIIIEESLARHGNYPVDYKFYCFGGRVHLLELHFRRNRGQTVKIFDRNFRPLAIQPGVPTWDGEFDRPSNFEDMLACAEALSADFQFIRVDLYNVLGEIYFGELTPYPGGVGVRLLPKEQDHHYGTLWE